MSALPSIVRLTPASRRHAGPLVLQAPASKLALGPGWQLAADTTIATGFGTGSRRSDRRQLGRPQIELRLETGTTWPSGSIACSSRPAWSSYRDRSRSLPRPTAALSPARSSRSACLRSVCAVHPCRGSLHGRSGQARGRRLRLRRRRRDRALALLGNDVVMSLSSKTFGAIFAFGWSAAPRRAGRRRARETRGRPPAARARPAVDPQPVRGHDALHTIELPDGTELQPVASWRAVSISWTPAAGCDAALLQARSRAS